MVWSQVEASVGVIAACLPTLKPLLHGQSPESILRSLRSRLSLHSSRASASSKSDHNEGDMEAAVPSSESRRKIRDSDDSEFDYLKKY